LGSGQEVHAEVTGNGYARIQRLLHARDFSCVFEQAEYRVSSRNFLLLGRLNETGCSRLGLIVSRKKVGKAVKRNRVKRLSREVFRTWSGNRSCLDIVIVARAGLNEIDNQTLLRLLGKSFDQLLQKYSEKELKKAARVNHDPD
jgi:ribonuclease P protein component